jgi:hypothetical protein
LSQLYRDREVQLRETFVGGRKHIETQMSEREEVRKREGEQLLKEQAEFKEKLAKQEEVRRRRRRRRCASSHRPRPAPCVRAVPRLLSWHHRALSSLCLHT